MKFIESMYGELINIDEISKITVESIDHLEKNYSYIYLKNDEKIEFFEFPFDVSKLTHDLLLLFLKEVLECILDCPDRIISRVRINGWLLNRIKCLT